jgi:hypothetical protein
MSGECLPGTLTCARTNGLKLLLSRQWMRFKFRLHEQVASVFSCSIPTVDLPLAPRCCRCPGSSADRPLFGGLSVRCRLWPLRLVCSECELRFAVASTAHDIITETRQTSIAHQHRDAVLLTVLSHPGCRLLGPLLPQHRRRQVGQLWLRSGRWWSACWIGVQRRRWIPGGSAACDLLTPTLPRAIAADLPSSTRRLFVC